MANSAPEDKSNAASGQQTTMDQAALKTTIQQVMSLPLNHLFSLLKRSAQDPILKTGDDWPIFKSHVLYTLHGAQLLELIEGEIDFQKEAPNITDDIVEQACDEMEIKHPTASHFRRRLNQALALIFQVIASSLDHALRSEVHTVSDMNPRTLWNNLKERFDERTRLDIQDLRRQYRNFTKEPQETIAQLQHRFQTLASKLSSRDVSLHINDQIDTIILSLPDDEYKLVKHSINQTLKDKDLTLARVWADLRDFEARHVQTRKDSTLFNTNRGRRTARICLFYKNGNCKFGTKCRFSHQPHNNDQHRNHNSRHHNYPRQHTSKNNGNTRSNVTCKFCDKKGHTTHDCRALRRVQDKISKLNIDRTSDHNHSTTESKGSGAVSLCNAEITTTSLHQTLTTGRKNTKKYLSDSGATDHLVCDDSDLINKRETNVTLKLPDGRTHTLHTRGDLILRTTVLDIETRKRTPRLLLLSNVLCAPMLNKNVISSPALDQDNFTLIQQEGKVDFFDREQRLCGTATLQDGLFWLDATADTHAQVNSLKLWHQRLGHLCKQHLHKTTSLTPGLDFKKNDLEPICSICLKGKMSKKPIPKKAQRRSTVPGERLHIDIQGPFKTTARNGAKYIFTVVDDATNRIWVRLLARKGDAVIALRNTHASIKTEGKTVRFIRLDNAGEHVPIARYCKEQGIMTEFSNFYSSHQNGKAERANRTVIEMINCLLTHCGLPHSFWDSAAKHTEYILQRVYTSAIDKTPFEAWYGQIPDLSHVRIFGCKAWVKIHGNKRLQPRSQEAFLIGMAQGPRNYNFWVPSNNRVLTSADVIFDEQTTYRHYKRTRQEEKESDEQHQLPLAYFAEEEEKQAEEERAQHHQEQEVQEEEEHHEEEQHQEDEPEAQSQPLRRSRRNTVPPQRFIEVVNTEHFTQPSPSQSSASFANLIAEAHNIITDEPKTFQDAINSPDSKQWQEAMNQEMKTLQDKKTWTLTELPLGRTAIKGRWIYKLKHRPDGTISRHKARFVACGYTQRKGIDYHETFATVSKMKTVRTLEAVAAHLGLFIQDFDVKGAYLHGQLEEEIYMVQPQGYVSDTQPNYVCKLNKALYGLKQSARQWNQELRTTLTKSGYIPTGVDTNLFVCKRGNTLTLVPVWVDDMRAASNSKQGLGQLTCVLKDKYVINDNDESNWFIGLHTTRTPTWTKLDQQLLISKILAKFNMTNCNPAPTPSVTKMQLTQATDTEHKEMANVPFRQLLGSVLYVAVTSRPDVMTAVAAIARHCNKPSRTHWQALKRVLRYLKGTQHHGITYLRASCSTEPLQLQGYCDATWADNFETGRSTTGYFFSLAGGAISWSSKLQTTVAKSSAEAEYMAVDAAACEAIWLRQLLKAMHQPQREATPICIDNQAAIAMAKYDKFHNRSKHINVKYHYIRELLEHKQVTLPWVSTHDNPADLLTKSLAKTKFIKFRDKILGEDSATSSPDSSLRRSVGRALPVK